VPDSNQCDGESAGQDEPSLKDDTAKITAKHVALYSSLRERGGHTFVSPGGSEGAPSKLRLGGPVFHHKLSVFPITNKQTV
jgi:hypothetical protein